jgi:ComF family protein
VSGWRAVARVLRSPARAARTLVDDLMTTVLPADYRCCGGPLGSAGMVPVCEACVGRVTPNLKPGCGRCGEFLDFANEIEEMRSAGMLPEGFLCRECRLAAPDFERAVAYGNYDTEMRALIGLLKFHRVSGVARLLGARLGEALLGLESIAAKELKVIAVPLFPLRERQRGYNQSRLLADEALPWLRRERPEWTLTADHGALIRRRSTESSFLLSHRGRRQNLKGAFKVCGDVAGREILLIDDILTSGATARECARVLTRAGAARVWVATVARAQKRTGAPAREDPGESVAAWDLPAHVEAATLG